MALLIQRNVVKETKRKHMEDIESEIREAFQIVSMKLCVFNNINVAEFDYICILILSSFILNQLLIG